MSQLDVKKLAAQLDAAQAILDNIRVNCGCDAIAPERKRLSERIEAALKTAERAYQERHSRSEFVGHKEMFGEPAWDMLLDLFIRQTKAEEISVKSACFNAEMPVSTAARWLQVLEQNGLIVSNRDPADATRCLIHLTATGYEGMLRYLESIA